MNSLTKQNKPKFEILSKLSLLQNLASFFISKTNPAIIHNIEKYIAIQKIVFLNSSEHQMGDYLEFGVYTGSSFCHAIRCVKECEVFNPKQKLTNFFGFDSFEGFGELEENDKHPFYIDQNFCTNFNKVKKRVDKTIGKWSKSTLIKGFFDDTLLVDPKEYGISKARIVFIDSDTYTSSKSAFDFIKDIVKPGTHIILDDYFSYQGNPQKGVACAFDEFIDQSSLSYRKILDYGVGGVAIVLH
jgi:O-methyltransferase